MDNKEVSNYENTSKNEESKRSNLEMGVEKDSSNEITREYVRLLVNQLKSTSWREVFKSLHRIRTRVILTDAGISLLKECKGFKNLVKHLTGKNEDILNSTLSILGNCCSKLVGDQDLREEVLQYGIAGHVISILKRSGAGSDLQKRACRLIGNLAQAQILSLELHRSGAVSAVLPLLASSTNSQVRQTAVRALRWLWDADKHHIDMIKYNCVKCVSSLMVTDDYELLLVVLRALVVFTQSCSNRIAEQVEGEGGGGYKRIVELLGTEHHVVSVLICNLSHSPPARVELSKAGIVPAIIEKLQGGATINAYLITALCVMCQESMVRASLRGDSKGFSTLLSLLENKKAKPFHPEILAAIRQFIYDHQSLMMMVHGGLISLLVGKLSEMKGEPHNEEEYKPSGGSGSDSPRSPSCWSPPPPTSPQPPQYSPSCSPTYECPESPPLISQGPSQEIPSPGSGHSSSASSMPGGEMSVVGEDGCILEVLSQLTYQNRPLRPLASKTTIVTFLDYLSTLAYPRSAHNYIKASRILGSIVSCKHYYNSLLEDESILRIHRTLCRPRHEGCSWCGRLRMTGKWVLGEARLAAQSGLGEGEMLHRLDLVSSQSSITTALTIPHVVKQPKLLHSLLFGHNGFQFLLDSLETHIEEAVPSLNELFITLGIDNPQKQVETCTSCEIGALRKEGNVTFQLDDGSTVSANKESLSHNCPMFEAMFRGGFKEASQTKIRLTEVSSDCLTYLTRAADEYCPCTLPKSLTTLLEMVAVADRWLLPDLSSCLLDFVMNQALNATSVPEVYHWAVTGGGQVLSIAEKVPADVVKFLIKAESILPAARVEATRKIMESPNKARFLQDLEDLTIQGLKTYTKNFRFHPGNNTERSSPHFPPSPMYFFN